MDFNFQNINVGQEPGGQRDGDLVRNAFIKVNENFDLIKLQLEDFDPADIQQQLDDLQEQIDGNDLDISDIMEQLLTINNQLSSMIPDDAPSDGKKYGRKDGDWSEIKQTSDDISNESIITGATVTDALNNLDTNKLDKTPDGTNNLIDVDNKLNPIYLPPNIMHLQGEWNAYTNTPTLSNGTGIAGYIYEVTTAGTTDFGDGDIEFALGDWVVYGGDGKWYKSPNTGEVVGVKGSYELDYRKGLVNIDINDVIAPSTNQFLVGNSIGSDWMRRGIIGSDLGITSGGANMIPAWSTNSNQWISPFRVNEIPNTLTVPIRTNNPNPGRLKANPAVDSDDLVPLGQLEGMLSDIEGLPTPTANEFLVGNSAGTDWEKRGITVYDLVDSPPSAGVRLVGASFTTGTKAGYSMSPNPVLTSSTVVQWSPGGVLKGNDAVASNDLVPLGQLEGMLSDIEGLPTPTANEFLIGNSAGTDWEKRRILPIDYNISAFGTFRVPVCNNAFGWINGGIPVASNYTPVAAALPRYTTNPDSGRLKANDAIESNDLVPLGQLEGKLLTNVIKLNQTTYITELTSHRTVILFDYVDNGNDLYIPHPSLYAGYEIVVKFHRADDVEGDDYSVSVSVDSVDDGLFLDFNMMNRDGSSVEYYPHMLYVSDGTQWIEIGPPLSN